MPPRSRRALEKKFKKGGGGGFPVKIAVYFVGKYYTSLIGYKKKNLMFVHLYKHI